jgi:uncharacterized repeat protein (TIGR01451 family)
MTIARHVKNASLALIALSSVGALSSAYAVGTPSGTSITNTATVDYSVGSVAQTQLTAASTPFQVDTRIDFTVTEVGSSATIVTPGQTNVALTMTTFRVSNTGNSTQGYTVAATNEPVGGAPTWGGPGNNDTVDVNNVRLFVDDGDGVFDAGDTATSINSLPMDNNLLVFVFADIPLVANNSYANVRLTAQATAVGGGAPLDDTPTADTAGVEIVIADAGLNNSESDIDQYWIQSAALSLSKSSTLISDPFNGTGANRKAIPGAVIEYTITVSNASTTQAADGVIVTDTIPATTSFVPGSILLGTTSLPDSNFSAGTLTVNAGTVTAAPGPGATATVRFRVTIN